MIETKKGTRRTAGAAVIAALIFAVVFFGAAQTLRTDREVAAASVQV